LNITLYAKPTLRKVLAEEGHVPAAYLIIIYGAGAHARYVREQSDGGYYQTTSEHHYG
jgi:hypothetical protein